MPNTAGPKGIAKSTYCLEKLTIPMLIRPIYSSFFDGSKTKFRRMQGSTLNGHTEEKKKNFLLAYLVLSLLIGKLTDNQ